ncbi:SPOR domain-containing protein [Marinospirillum perlucidum]|uniref:SPOR domain-containing protein n=1 Tax=Marinospirillum perlucidum TaxID=1982602 RepID=UPI000DF2AF04|nr:SPOR domain-containing protein [Marinospirillum perlucidum]
MRYGLKERLVGAVALIALAVIFLPFVLEEERAPLPLSDKIITPPTPDPLEVEVDRPEAPQLSATHEETQTAETSSPEQGASSNTSESSTSVDEDSRSALMLAEEGGVEAWSIQVASFSDDANAKRMVTRLREQQYRPYWRKINGLAVVFVGPFITQQQARTTQDKLLQALGVKTLLKAYVSESVAREQGSLPESID